MPAPLQAEEIRTALRALLALQKRGRFATMSHAIVALSLAEAQLEGHPHTLRSLSLTTKIPYTSVSRIVFALSVDCGGFVEMRAHEGDRRKKTLYVDMTKLRREIGDLSLQKVA